MKKLITMLFVFLFVVASSFAQEAFNKGDKTGSVGLGFGFAGIYGDAGMPPISLGFQYGIDKKISVGGILGYTSSSYSAWEYKWTYSYIVIGARGEYHFLDNKLWDVYGGLTLGYAIVSVSTPSGYNGYGYSAGNSYAVYGFHAGARYFVSPKVAIFGELGYGIGYLTLGASFRL